MQQLQQQGYDRDLVLESLLAGDCNAATAAYHLMQQALAMRQEALYSTMQPSQQPGSSQADMGLQGKRIDTPMRILSTPQTGPAAGILAYRPNQAGLEVAAGGKMQQKQHAGHVSDDSAEALHQSAALHATNQC